MPPTMSFMEALARFAPVRQEMQSPVRVDMEIDKAGETLVDNK